MQTSNNWVVTNFQTASDFHSASPSPLPLSMLFILFFETSAHCVALAALELAEIDVPGLKVGFTLAHIYSCLAVPTTQNTDWTRTQGLRTVRDSSISMAPTSRPPHRPPRCQSGAFSVVSEGCRLQHFFWALGHCYTPSGLFSGTSQRSTIDRVLS